MANITLSHEAIHYPTVPAHEILTHYATVDLVDWLKIEGDCRIDDDGSFRVYISDPLCEYSYEWPYAHELGHIVLGHCTRSLRQVLKQQEAVFSREADIFAAELLMPAAWVAEQYAQYEIRNFRDLRHYVQGYGVSWYVMKRRLMELGLCKQELLGVAVTSKKPYSPPLATGTVLILKRRVLKWEIGRERFW